MCAVFGFLDHKGKISNAVLKRLIHYLSIAAEVRGTDATGIAYVRDGSMVTYKKPKPAHKVKLFFPRGTRSVIGQRGVRPRPQRRAVQRQRASPGTASPTDTNRNRHLRRRAASGTGTEP